MTGEHTILILQVLISKVSKESKELQLHDSQVELPAVNNRKSYWRNRVLSILISSILIFKLTLTFVFVQQANQLQKCIMVKFSPNCKSLVKNIISTCSRMKETSLHVRSGQNQSSTCYLQETWSLSFRRLARCQEDKEDRQQDLLDKLLSGNVSRCWTTTRSI